MRHEVGAPCLVKVALPLEVDVAVAPLKLHPVSTHGFCSNGSVMHLLTLQCTLYACAANQQLLHAAPLIMPL